VIGRSSKTGGPHSGRHAGGRPRKFAEPSRPITITLPATTLRQLQQIDSDRGRAIVKLAKNAASVSAGHAAVEILEISPAAGLVVIGPAPSLVKIDFLQLVEVAPARFLLALAPGHDFHQLEIALTDLIDDLPAENGAERQLVSQLLGHIKSFRKSEGVSMAQILLLRLKTAT